ncbi:uncharacterized protein LOC5521990 [Nematostella vectensis]|uniref:uncharacterized protein LOC5521990 n=1 Tax=Nematostella vectensis TaxID=45351 RepID=UPI0020773A5D|nr:uncharacterized protein LOC5521990 [Nematostella vectensis]
MPSKTIFVLLICLAALVTKIVRAEYCSSDFSCNYGSGRNRICCNNHCTYSPTCDGYSCSMDSDCNGGYASLSCCNSVCQFGDCYNPVPAIIGSLVGIGVVVVIVTAIIYFCCCRRPVRSAGGRVITAPQQQIITTTTTNYPPPAMPYQGAQGPYQPPGYYPGYGAPPQGNYAGGYTSGGQPSMGMDNGGASYAPPPSYSECAQEPAKSVVLPSGQPTSHPI